jgi:hypothetical protein
MRTSILAIPDEYGVLDSLGNDGHTSDQSLCELIDNSIDAQATQVRIKIAHKQKEKNSKKTSLVSILVVDDGIGITFPKIEGVLRLGAKNKSNNNIGKYGFGLKSAAFNLANKVTIVSKVKHGDVIGVVWDRTDTARKNFEIPLLSEKEATDLYNKYSSFTTGTIIILENVNPSVNFSLASKDNEDNLKVKIGKYYNKKISDAFKVFINEALVQPVNILGEKYDVLLDSKIGSGIGIQAVEIYNGASEATRGIYIEFRGRIINLAPLQDRKFKMDHATFNYLRVLITIPDWSCVDKYKGLSISNQKNGVRIEGDFLNELMMHLEPVCKNYKKTHEIDLDSKSFEKESPVVVVLKNKKEESWNKIGSIISLVEGAVFSADELKNLLAKENPKHYDKEPRTLCKFDSKDQLPQILKKLDLCPVSIKNGYYKLIKSPFIDVPPLNLDIVTDYDITEKDKENISLQHKDLSSERKVLNYVQNIGLLEHALGDKLVPTIGGLEFSGETLNYFWNDKKESAESIQIEVDAGYEGKNGVYLVEAKMCPTEDGPNSLNIRQIVIPQISYSNKIGKIKPVKSYACFYYSQVSIVRIIPIFIDSVNGVYHADNENEKSYRLILK